MAEITIVQLDESKLVYSLDDAQFEQLSNAQPILIQDGRIFDFVGAGTTNHGEWIEFNEVEPVAIDTFGIKIEREQSGDFEAHFLQSGGATFIWPLTEQQHKILKNYAVVTYDDRTFVMLDDDSRQLHFIENTPLLLEALEIKFPAPATANPPIHSLSGLLKGFGE